MSHDPDDDMYDPDDPDEHPPFDGETYDPERDGPRLNKQLKEVFDLMRDGKWRTYVEISSLTGYASSASVTARLRDLRKKKFGGYTVEKRYLVDGVWEYRLLLTETVLDGEGK